MSKEKQYEKKEGEFEHRELPERKIEELKEKEKKELPSEKKEEKRREVLKEKIEKEFRQEQEDLDSHRKKIEEKLEELEEHFMNLAYEDLNKALKSISKLEPHKKDKAIDTLCRDKVFWHLVRTGQIDYEG